MASPPAQESKRRRARDAVQRGLLQVKEVFRSSSSPQNPSPTLPGSSTQPVTTELVLSQEHGTTAVASGSAANPQSSTLAKFKDASNVAWSGLEAALRVLEKSADLFSPFKSAVGGLISCLDIVQVTSDFD